MREGKAGMSKTAKVCARYVALAVIAALAATVGDAFGQGTEDNPNATGNIIIGNVEIDGAGPPKERLEIHVATPTGRGSTRVYTDATGRFIVRGLFSGSYLVTVKAPQFADYEDGSTEVLISGGVNTFSTYSVTVLLRRKVAAPTYTIRGRTIDARESDRQIPGPARKLYRRGVEFARKGQRDDAIASFRQALEIAPEYLFALNDLAVQLTRAKAYDEAIDVLRAAIRIAPTSFPPHLNLGIAFLAKGAYNEAEKASGEAVAIDPTAPEPYFIRGKALRELGQKDEAISAFHKAYQEGGLDLIIVQIEIGQLYEEQGQTDAAAEAYQTFLSLVAQGREADYARARLRALGR